MLIKEKNASIIVDKFKMIKIIKKYNWYHTDFYWKNGQKTKKRQKIHVKNRFKFFRKKLNDREIETYKMATSD